MYTHFTAYKTPEDLIFDYMHQMAKPQIYIDKEITKNEYNIIKDLKYKTFVFFMHNKKLYVVSGKQELDLLSTQYFQCLINKDGFNNKDICTCYIIQSNNQNLNLYQHLNFLKSRYN
jgi:hypothetical protein